MRLERVSKSAPIETPSLPSLPHESQNPHVTFTKSKIKLSGEELWDNHPIGKKIIGNQVFKVIEKYETERVVRTGVFHGYTQVILHIDFRGENDGLRYALTSHIESDCVDFTGVRVYKENPEWFRKKYIDC